MTFYVLPDPLYPVWSWVAGLLTFCAWEHHEGPPQQAWTRSSDILEGDTHLPQSLGNLTTEARSRGSDRVRTHILVNMGLYRPQHSSTTKIPLRYDSHTIKYRLFLMLDF